MWCSLGNLLQPRLAALLTGLLAALFVVTGFAQPVFPSIDTRKAALAALEKEDARVRVAAVAYLGRTGLAVDGPLLIKRLMDENPLVRELAEQNVWLVWSRSGDARIDQLLIEGTAQMQGGDLVQAIETFTAIIKRKPGFAEGWNKRATAYFLAGELQKSLFDCDEVMKRNPQHFGALSGYGQIYLRLEELDKSLAYFRRALGVNPNMEGVEASIRAIEELQRAKLRRTI